MADIPNKRKRFWRWGVFASIAVGVAVLAIGVLAPCFVRAKPLAEKNACIANLREIDDAKEQWALETRRPAGATLITTEVERYFRHGRPNCPSGGAYDYGKVGEVPRCSTKDHTL
jgi:hypothetical protein